MTKYQIKNRDKKKKYDKEYRQKNKERIKIRARNYIENHRKQHNNWCKLYNRKNPPSKEILYARNIRRLYNMSLDDYKNLLLKQNMVCAICRTKTTKRLSVDHCHKTNKVRGLLCSKCNRGIGFLNDDINLLKSAVKYLKVT